MSTFGARGDGGRVYPLGNPNNKGYGVATPKSDPAKNQWNGRFVGNRNENIEFWIENIEASFEMAGSTGQSHKLRQFFPHNMVQPSVTVTGRAPNQFQYNRLAAFVRQSHWDALSTRELSRDFVALRTTSYQGVDRKFAIPTVQLIVRAGGGDKFPYSGRNVKGLHKAWKLEGYIKTMAAGGKRFDHAPQFVFQFLIAESVQSKTSNVGIWSDTAVQGSLIKPWIDIFKSRGMENFVKIDDDAAQKKANDDPTNDLSSLLF